MNNNHIIVEIVKLLLEKGSSKDAKMPTPKVVIKESKDQKEINRMIAKNLKNKEKFEGDSVFESPKHLKAHNFTK